MSESPRRHPNVVRAEEVEPRTVTKGTRFGFRSRLLGRATGGRGIGCTLYEVEPGRAAFPAHYHTANEEALYILEGQGTLRIGGDRVVVGAGDYVTLPVGPEHAHRLDNSGSKTLRYLCFSTLHNVEIVGYPDSNKIGAMAMESFTTMKPWVRNLFSAGTTLDYYEGEDVG